MSEAKKTAVMLHATEKELAMIDAMKKTLERPSRSDVIRVLVNYCADVFFNSNTTVRSKIIIEQSKLEKVHDN